MVFQDFHLRALQCSIKNHFLASILTPILTGFNGFAAAVEGVVLAVQVVDTSCSNLLTPTGALISSDRSSYSGTVVQV